jgi:hypothetical protein
MLQQSDLPRTQKPVNPVKSQVGQILSFFALTAVFWYLHPALAAVYVAGLVVHVVYRWSNKGRKPESSATPADAESRCQSPESSS